MRSRGDESWRLEDNTERKHAPLEVPEEAMRSPLLNKCSRLLKLTPKSVLTRAQCRRTQRHEVLRDSWFSDGFRDTQRFDNERSVTFG